MHADGGQALRRAAVEALPAVRESKRFYRVALLVAERSVLSWLTQSNAKGVAARRAELVRSVQQCWPEPVGNALAALFLHRVEHLGPFAAKWALQFRKRWQVAWRRLPARPLVLRDELVVKVPGGPQTELQIGPTFGGHFWFLFLCPFI